MWKEGGGQLTGHRWVRGQRLQSVFLQRWFPVDRCSTRFFYLLVFRERSVFPGGKLFADTSHCHNDPSPHAVCHTMQKDLLPPTGQQQELQGHSVSLYADLDGSLWSAHFPLLGKAPLVLLQQADAFLIALQRTNHSSADYLTSCVQIGPPYQTTRRKLWLSGWTLTLTFNRFSAHYMLEVETTQHTHHRLLYTSSHTSCVFITLKCALNQLIITFIWLHKKEVSQFKLMTFIKISLNW